MTQKIKRDAAYIASRTDAQIEDCLLMLDIGERFDGDRAFLTRLWDDDHSVEKWDALREIIIKANPHRHSSIFTPSEGEPAIPASPMTKHLPCAL